MNRSIWRDPMTWGIFACLFILIVLGVVECARARDGGDWEKITPEIRAWYRSLQQPDNPAISCCGEADAYYADSYEMACTGEGEAKKCEYVAIITDERVVCDGTVEAVDKGCVLGRPHIPPGTKIVVPNKKLKYDAGNPTGHGVIFVQPPSTDEDGYSTGYTVLCHIVPGGV